MGKDNTLFFPCYYHIFFFLFWYLTVIYLIKKLFLYLIEKLRVLMITDIHQFRAIKILKTKLNINEVLIYIDFYEFNKILK